MKPFYLSIGWLCGVFFVAICTWEEPSKGQVGHTYSELRQMKNSCEKYLPRSQSCVINVSYTPQVVIKTEEEK
jgi:hypothetical protein